MISAQDLKVIEIFDAVPEHELEWLASHVQERKLAQGDAFFVQGEEADRLLLILAGKTQLIRHADGKEQSTLLYEAGKVTGKLPFSRMKVQAASAFALEPMRVAEFDVKQFPELHAHAPTVVQQMVYEMLDRSRSFTREISQRDKLVSLGTLAAGLAHELNNPASAAKRAAQNLTETLQAFDEHSSAILKKTFFLDAPDSSDPFQPIYDALTANEELSSLERSDREDELADWLEEHDVARPYDVASVLVSGGLSKATMKNIADQLVPEQVKGFLEWVPKDVEMRLLSSELMESTTRISDLVNAMKSYTYMDQGFDKQEVDLHEGIVNTLVILKHKVRAKNIDIVKNFADVPPIQAYGSELNQVWTNIIVNAVEAMDEGGTITINSTLDGHGNMVCVDIIDNGPGIPPDVQKRIFEPFFTTKGVGQGTGLGLDITSRIIRDRHHGTIQVNSEPGNTRFRIRLPL